MIWVSKMCLVDVIKRHQANALICDIECDETALLSNSNLGFEEILLEIHYLAGRAGVNRLINHLIPRASQSALTHLDNLW